MSNENENMIKLCNKILAITIDLGNVSKDGNNTHNKYRYISYEQMNSKMRYLLPKHKMAIIPEITEVRETTYQAKNNTGVRSLIKATFQVVDCETGFSITKQWSGGDQDTGGKSLSQATTECHKRFLLKLFNVSSKNDVDPDSRTESMPNNQGSISEAQAKRFYTICKSQNLTDEKITAWLFANMGIETANQINAESYEAVCNDVEAGCIK